MGIRKWFARQRQEADADALERAEEEVFETPEERKFSEGDRYGLAADNRIARRAGEASIQDVDRLSD